MTEPEEPPRRFLATSPHTFISFAKGELLHDPSLERCFLPTALSQQRGRWNWNFHAYATVLDTPMTGNLVEAALVVMHDKLTDRVVLPPKSISTRASIRTSIAIY